MRTCRRCSETKPLREFYAGRHVCKSCYAEDRSDYRARNREQAARSERERRQVAKVEQVIVELREDLVLRAMRLLLAEFATLDEFAERFRAVATDEGYAEDSPVVLDLMLAIGDGGPSD